MNKSTSSASALREAQLRQLENAASIRPHEDGSQVADVGRYLAAPETIKPILAQLHYPATKPFDASPHVHVAAEDTVQGGSYLARRLQMIFRPGIGLKARLRAIPVLGYAMSIVTHIIRAPLVRQQHELRLQSIESLRHQVAQLNLLLNQRIDEVGDTVRQSAQLSEQNLNLLDRRLQQQESSRANARLQSLEMLDVGHRLMMLEKIETERKLRQFSSLLQHAEKENVRLRTTVLELSSRIHTLSHANPQGSLLDFAAPTETETDKLGIDEFFKAFEDTFRGSKNDIKKRLEVYLPYLQSAHVDQHSQVIDVGCGRGEWLELLAENHIPALGVDLNLAKVQACIADGLAAKVGDAIQFLREQPAGSVAAVSGFHIIEHLSFETMLALFDAAHHALRPGGLLILETPNPENILVGACNFHFDPTHLKPIVPVVAQFIAQQRGFADAEILRLHPFPKDHHTTGDTDADLTINRYFFGPQDYAVIARK